jgi:hypothetical protein
LITDTTNNTSQTVNNTDQPTTDQAIQALLIPTLIALVASVLIALITTLIDMLTLSARITRAHVVHSISLIISNILKLIGMMTVTLRAIRSTIKRFWLASLLTPPFIALAIKLWSTQYNAYSMCTICHLPPLLLALCISISPQPLHS